ncbi:MAG: hypothetical protein GF384_01175 [Elusimicrobia bacterium]|nr:hypothetical protein [Elusimicrobiota bacterium]
MRWRVMHKIIMVVIVMMVGALAGIQGAGFGIDRSRIRPRIITPNDDGRNDTFWVFYQNPLDSEVTGEIFDCEGAKVADMTHKNGAEEYSLCWDGTDGSGRVVPAGVYIYQITAEDSVFNGTVVVAR